MYVDLEGMLKNRDPYMLGELAKHLREMRDRWRAGDTTVVDEFFRLYLFHESDGVTDAT